MDIKWETPPSPARGPGAGNEDDREFADALRQNPEQWARYREFEGDQQRRAGNLAQTIRKGQRAAFRAPVGTFEAVSRRVPDTAITAVYVRYVTLNND